MKRISFLLASVLFFNILTAQHKTFLRIYNEQGKKITKGFFAATSDSAVILQTNDGLQQVSFARVGKIKIKRSAGHTIAVVTGISVAAFTIVFIAGSGGDSFLSYSAADGALAGLAAGSAGGLFYGSIIGLLKNSHTYLISGNYANWLKAKVALNKLPVLVSIEK